MLDSGHKQNGQNRASPEEFLRDYAKSLNRHRKNRRAVLVRMSLLSRQYSKSHHHRAAEEAFVPARRQSEGELFNLSNGDIVCALHRARPAALDDAVLKIRLMFRDDQNLKFLEESGRDDLFCQWFDLEQDYDGFFDLAKRRFQGETKVHDLLTPEFAARNSNPGTNSQQGGREVPTHNSITETDPLTHTGGTGTHGTNESLNEESQNSRRLKANPKIRFVEIKKTEQKMVKMRHFSSADLAKIDHSLRTIDLASLIKKQSVKLMAGEKSEVVFSELSVPVMAIQESILPQCDLASDLQLLRLLRRLTDHRALSTISDEMEMDSSPHCIRTTVRSTLDPAFDRFHNRHGRTGAKRIILEYSFIDVLGDFDQYLIARSKVREMGYRLCIGDLDSTTFCMMDRKRISANFEKLRYSKPFDKSASKEQFSELKGTIAAAGRHRIILVACQNKNAFRFGQRVGISLFQGDYVELL